MCTVGSDLRGAEEEIAVRDCFLVLTPAGLRVLGCVFIARPRVTRTGELNFRIRMCVR